MNSCLDRSRVQGKDWSNSMRWKTEIERKPYHGQQRIVTRFALFPVKTEDGEVRWLERVNIMQTYLINPSGHWVNDYFIE